jgi:hypothetical protein
MRQIRPDLWETRADAPFPGLTTHAYLWTPSGAGPGGPAGPAGNVLFYNTAGDDDLEEIARLGGVAHQYLSHQDEVAPMLATYRQRGSRLEGHPSPVLPWVDVATGSLGQGLPIGVGMALAARRLDRLANRIWVLCGDGELAERPRIVVLTKVEGLEPELIREQEKTLKKVVAKGTKIMAISSKAHIGTVEVPFEDEGEVSVGTSFLVESFQEDEVT